MSLSAAGILLLLRVMVSTASEFRPRPLPGAWPPLPFSRTHFRAVASYTSYRDVEARPDKGPRYRTLALWGHT